jgi:hypothetical protein
MQLQLPKKMILAVEFVKTTLNWSDMNHCDTHSWGVKMRLRTWQFDQFAILNSVGQFYRLAGKRKGIFAECTEAQDTMTA